MKNPDRAARTIDYRLNIIGIRVSEASCQLIARDGDGNWSTIGPRRDLPIHVPRDSEEMKMSSVNTLLLTAYQYITERPGSDLDAVLNKTKDFAAALEDAPAPKRLAKAEPE